MLLHNFRAAIKLTFELSKAHNFGSTARHRLLNELSSCSRRPSQPFRSFSSQNSGRGRYQGNSKRNQNVVLYATAGVLATLGASYASVPLYRIYCQSTGKGGRAVAANAEDKIENMKPVKERMITVKFEADTESQMAWRFKPTQSQVKVAPGETALAFYTANNPLDHAINGVATYSVMPYEAGLYLNKIQCFCFEEQRLNPNEEVDMPVFFYIDPEYATDPRLENIDDIVLSYVFFEAKEGAKLPFINHAKASK